jgi:hypothetical protein
VSVLGTAITAIAAHLASVFPAAEVVKGNRTGVSRDKDRIAIFNPGFPVTRPDLAFSNPKIIVRYFVSRSKQLDSDATPDPTSLYDAQEALLAAFQGKDVTGSFAANFACVAFETTVDDTPEEWRVDLTITTYTFNPAKHAA